MVEALLAWRPTSPSIPGRLEELYVLMYEMDILGASDVKLAQAWVGDLLRLGYKFPAISGGGWGAASSAS